MVDPYLIGSESDAISLSVQRQPLDWSVSELSVKRSSDGVAVVGGTVLQGNALSFSAITGSYEPGEAYDLQLTTLPNQSLDGGHINLDMPRRIVASNSFDQAEIAIKRFAPATAVAGQTVEFTVYGQGLNTVERLVLGSLELNSSQFNASADGSRITFNAAVNTVGLVSVAVSQGTTTDGILAALNVVPALSIDSVESSSNLGTTSVSNLGGDQITVNGQGFTHDLTVHWLRAGVQMVPDASNKVAFHLSGGEITFNAPAAQYGQAYEVAIKRVSTGELVFSGEQNQLLAVDNSKPKVTVVSVPSYQNALILEGDEALVLASLNGFSVTKTFKDYSDLATSSIDVSNRFVLSQLSDTRIKLGLREGFALEHNALYTFVISGITDTAQNLPFDGEGMIAGVYTTSFVANDTLPAKLDSIRLALNGSYVESTTSLKRGAAYTFIPQAEDNYQTSAQLRYQYRVSFDGGLNFVNNWTQSEEFTLQVPSYASNLVLKVRVTDASANAIEKNFHIVTVPASVQLSSNPQFPAFFTNPELVEELNPSEIGFHLVGDLELIKTAEIKVFDDGVWQPALVDSSTGKTSIQFNQPRLSDLNGQTTIPVRLRVAYGLQSETTIANFAESYELNPDSTAPTLAFVAP